MQKINRLALFMSLLLVSLTPASSVSAADLLDEIRTRDKLRVGVSLNNQPYSYRDKTGTHQGLELDLATELAKQLEVELEVIGLQTGQRLPALNRGQVDVIIAGVSHRPGLEHQAEIVEPAYYGSGLTILTHSRYPIQSWQDIRGMTVCSLQGAAYNLSIKTEYGVKTDNYKNIYDALNSLYADNCRALLYYDSFLVNQRLSDPRWGNYQLPLPSLNEQPWVMLVPKQQELLKMQVSDVLVEWHRSGMLLELQKKWAIPASAYLENLHQSYK